jgi:hypothetical protein
LNFPISWSHPFWTQTEKEKKNQYLSLSQTTKRNPSEDPSSFSPRFQSPCLDPFSHSSSQLIRSVSISLKFQNYFSPFTRFSFFPPFNFASFCCKLGRDWFENVPLFMGFVDLVLILRSVVLILHFTYLFLWFYPFVNKGKVLGFQFALVLFN